MADAKIGTLSIDKAYIGSDEVQKMYLGETEVWSAGGGGGTYTVILTNSESECPYLSFNNDAGVQYSTDGGTTWTPLGSGLDDSTTTITLTDISTLMVDAIYSWEWSQMYGWDGSAWQTISTDITGIDPADFTSLLGTYTKFAVRIDT